MPIMTSIEKQVMTPAWTQIMTPIMTPVVSLVVTTDMIPVVAPTLTPAVTPVTMPVVTPVVTVVNNHYILVMIPVVTLAGRFGRRQRNEASAMTGSPQRTPKKSFTYLNDGQWYAIFGTLFCMYMTAFLALESSGLPFVIGLPKQREHVIYSGFF